MLRIVWALLALGSSAWARPYYVTETTLAERLETQSEVVANPNAYSLPPLPGKWGAAVLDALVDGDTSRAKDLVGILGTKTAEAANAEALAGSLRVALVTGGAPFQELQATAPLNIVEASRSSQAALGLLVVALEARGEGKAVFVSIAVKGAINKWNALVGEAVKRWQALAQKRDGQSRQEMKALEAFLNSKHTEGIHDALAAFRTP